MLNPLEKQLLNALKRMEEADRFQAEGKTYDYSNAVLEARAAIAEAEAAAVVDPLEQRIRDLANELWDDDECTVESDTLVAISEEDGAAWIKVWQLMSADTLREHGIKTPGMDSEETEAEESAGA